MRRDVLGDVPGVPPDAADVLGRERVEEVEADEVEARLGRHAALVYRSPVDVEHGHVDPAEVLAKAGAPDHVRDVQHPPILQHGTPVLDACGLRHLLDVRVAEIV